MQFTKDGSSEASPSEVNNHRRHARRVAYTLAAGAAASGADAEVVYFAGEGIAVNQGFSQNLDIDGDGNNDLLLKNYVFFGGNYQGASVTFTPGRLVAFRPAGIAYATALNANAVINATTTSEFTVGSLAYGVANPNSQFNNVTGAFIGLSFPIGGALPENLHYGWVRVSINNSAGTFSIDDWAYENVAGVGILAGDTGPLGTPGDFNQDGFVDAADYTVWRDNLDSETALPNGAGAPVGQGDYDLWFANFMPIAPAPPEAMGAHGAVPEPSTLGLLAAGSLGVSLLRRKRGLRA